MSGGLQLPEAGSFPSVGAEAPDSTSTHEKPAPPRSVTVQRGFVTAGGMPSGSRNGPCGGVQSGRSPSTLAM